MKIGLVRHFKVDIENPGPVNSEEYSQWIRNYDISPVIKKPVDLRGIDWNICYASDLPRARTTAETIYQGDISYTNLIREIDLELARIVEGQQDVVAWFNEAMAYWAADDKTLKEIKSHSHKRVNKFLDLVEAEADNQDKILVVCHGMIMTVIEEELRKRGFEGEEIIVPDNGELYLYERE